MPGTVLESFTLTGLPTFGTAYTPEVVASAGSPLLTAGTTYFLYEKETGGETNAWNFDPLAQMGLVTTSRNGSPYTTSTSTQGAFSIQVNAPAAVPEPPAAAAFACGALGLGGLIAARRKKARA